MDPDSTHIACNHHDFPKQSISVSTGTPEISFTSISKDKIWNDQNLGRSEFRLLVQFNIIDQPI